MYVRGELLAVGRFQVMATLQAARAYVLGLPIDLSMSWGLNRAIFYAAAKRGFKEKAVKERPKGVEKPIAEEKDVYFLGDEYAYKTEEGGGTYFIIGGEIQKTKDFEKQIESRFKGKFKNVWKEALAIVGSYDKDILLSQHEFFEKVYRPRRDELAEKWSEMVA